MAAVLGLSEAAVAQAALQSMGIHLSSAGTSSINTALDQDVNLSATDKTLVRALLGAMGTTEKGHHDERTQEEVTKPRTQGTHPPAMSRAGVSPAYDPDQHRLYGTRGEATEAARRIVQTEQPERAAEPMAPRPDEYALAASDEPSEGRARRSIQDNEAEASQDDGDWDPE